MLGRSVGEECWRTFCREVLEKSVVERSVVEKRCREVLEKSVGGESCCWRRVL